MTRKETINHIKELEKQYCADIANLGVEGWLKYLSDDVIFSTSGHHPPVKGKETVRKRLEGLYSSAEVEYHWDVEYVDVSKDRTMAYSYSLYNYNIITETEKKSYIGKDVNIWKLENGVFKVVMQIGNRERTKFDARKRRMAKAPNIRPYKNMKK